MFSTAGNDGLAKLNCDYERGNCICKQSQVVGLVVEWTFRLALKWLTNEALQFASPETLSSQV